MVQRNLLCASLQFLFARNSRYSLKETGPPNDHYYSVRWARRAAAERLAAMSTLAPCNKSNNIARIIRRSLLYPRWPQGWADQTSWCRDWSADVWICNGCADYRCVCMWLGTVDTQICPGSARDSDFLCESLFSRTICICAGCSHLATCQMLAACARLLNLQNQNITLTHFVQLLFLLINVNSDSRIVTVHPRAGPISATETLFHFNFV